MIQIPDCPIIRSMERTGYPPSIHPNIDEDEEDEDDDEWD